MRESEIRSEQEIKGRTASVRGSHSFEADMQNGVGKMTTDRPHSFTNSDVWLLAEQFFPDETSRCQAAACSWQLIELQIGAIQ